MALKFSEGQWAVKNAPSPGRRKHHGYKYSPKIFGIIFKVIVVFPCERILIRLALRAACEMCWWFDRGLAGLGSHGGEAAGLSFFDSF